MAENPDAKPNNDAAGAKPDNQQAGSQDTSKSTLLSGKPEDGKPDGDGKPADGKPADGKPADGKPADGKPADGKPGDKGKEGAPESYKDFSAPEGVTLDKNMLGKFATTAKELNLPQDGAQKLVDLAVEHQAAMLKEQNDRWAEIRQQWRDELKADKEFGGEKFNETVLAAKRTLAKYGSEKFTEFLESTGYGDNSELIRLLARVDKGTREDTTVDGQPAGSKGDSAADTLYPNQGKK